MSVSLINGHIDDDVQMTDNELIKALECCADEGLRCDECPYQSFKYSECYELITREALDLINRQKAKIEALQMDNKQLETDNFNANMNCEHLQAEIERLKEGWKADIVLSTETKAEAVKEFAERLKEHREIVGYDRDFDADIYGSHIRIDIDEFDNLLKERVGEG